MIDTLLPLLQCPETGTPLTRKMELLVSEKGAQYPIIDHIPRLLEPTKDEREEKEREQMQQFYEQYTFPGYDGIDSPMMLMEKARHSGFAKWLDQAISPFATVLEVGCGTGQMTNFLSMVSTRTLIGVDMSIASLTLGQTFACEHELANAHFLQGNIFALPLKEQSVDILICSGVLHHTPSPKEGYRELLKRVKPGGIIIIGLYNRYARIPLGIRKCIFRYTGKTMRWLDSHMRRCDVDQSKKEIWFADQYHNPHESWHSIDEVLHWFDETGVTFLSAVPAIAEATEAEEDGTVKLFAPHPRGTHPQHLLRQLGWMFTIGREGGLFVMVGQKQK